MSDEKQILDFWENKHIYKTSGVLTEKSEEFYRDEFINNYAKWSQNVKELNVTIKEHLEFRGFPMKYWEEMKYDWFCQQVIDLIAEWIKVNQDIMPQDVLIITEKLIADYIAICINKYNEHAYTINALLDSVKTIVMK